jgi:hypothetical protein
LPCFTGPRDNFDSWNSLSPDIQKQIESLGGIEGSKFFGKNIFDSAAQEIPVLIKKAGGEMVDYKVPFDEVQKWSDGVGKSVWEAWVKRTESQGYTDARDVLNTVQGLIKTYKL